MRLLFGKNRFTQTILWLATMWFTLSVVMAPFSLELPNLRRIF
jgi:preprotein translocase subunit SecG